MIEQWRQWAPLTHINPRTAETLLRFDELHCEGTSKGMKSCLFNC